MLPVIRHVRNLFLMMLCLSLCVLLAACNGGTGKGSETSSLPAPELVLAADGVTDFVIVRFDRSSTAETDVAMLVRKVMTAAGLTVKIQTDWKGEPVNEHEIVIGNSERLADAGLDVHNVGDDGYYCLVKDGRIYLAGATAAKTQQAAAVFLEDFFGYTGDLGAVPPVTDLAIPGDYDRSLRSEYPVTAIRIDGSDLRGYTIVTNTKSRPMKAAAELLRDELYAVSGIWLSIADSGEAGKRILLEPQDNASNFTVTVENGDLCVRTPFTDTAGTVSEFTRGLRNFCAETLHNAKGELALNKDLNYNLDVARPVTYKEFGAVGDGVHDDFAAVIEAHAYANAHGLPVKGDPGAVFYFGAHKTTAVIGTDTDWSECEFIFDDSNQPVDNRTVHFFHVKRQDAGTTLADLGVTSLKKGQTKIVTAKPLDKDTDYYVTVTNANVKQFIREGANQNDGTSQTDCFLLHGDGTVDPKSPIIWDFDTITSSNVYAVEKTPLTIKGGKITTIANHAESKYTYYTTNILVERSNTQITGLQHFVKGELDHGAPYDGIIQVNYCANVTISDVLLTAHYIYKTIGAAGTSVSMGTYDVRQRSAVNVTYRNCKQTTDILDTKYWGVFVSDFCKNLVLENCVFSRFDAHMGVTNATLKGCTLGHQCLNAIGHGTLLVEDCTLYGQNMINLRSDYGSTWNGDVIIRNCTWYPNKTATLTSNNVNVIGGSYSGFHDFGYECYMPRTLTIEGLHVVDGKNSSGYTGINIFGNITPANTGENYDYKVNSSGFPYHITESVSISCFQSDSGKKWNLSPNTYMYRNVKVTEKN